MDPDSARRLVVALTVTACRYVAAAVWPVILIIDLTLVGSGSAARLPGAVYGAALAVTCVALADWLRRSLLAAQAAADVDRDRMLARVHDRIAEESDRARTDLDRSVAWLLRRMERGS